MPSDQDKAGPRTTGGKEFQERWRAAFAEAFRLMRAALPRLSNPATAYGLGYECGRLFSEAGMTEEEGERYLRYIVAAVLEEAYHPAAEAESAGR